MSQTDLKNKCERLLHIYCEREIRAGRTVPDEVLNHVLGSYSGYVLPGFVTGRQQPRLDETDFLDRFEKFILTQRKENTPLSKCRHNLGDVSKIEQTVADTTLAVHSEVKNLTEVYHRLTEQRIKTENKFEDVVVSESLNMDVYELKMKLTHSKCLELLYKETPGTIDALKKLKKLVEDELSSSNRRLQELEESKTAYEDVSTNPQFLELLGKYRQLVDKKNRLELV